MLERVENLPLRAKIVLILSAVVVAYALIDGAIQRFVVYKSFEKLEQHEAARDMGRVRDAIDNERRHLEVRSWDWATSRDVYRFVGGNDPDYAAANLDDHTLGKNKLNLLILCNESGAVLWGRGTSDFDADTPPELRFRDFPMGALSSSHPLLMHLDPADAIQPSAGLMSTEHGPLLVCARYLLDERGRPPARGMVVMGRLLTPQFEEALKSQTGVEFTMKSVQDAARGEIDREAFDAATASGDTVVRAKDAKTLRTLLTLPDIGKAPALLLESSFDRAITERGTTALRYALLSTVAAGLLMMLSLLFLLQRAVLLPIASLTAHAVEIGRSEELTRKLGLTRTDEIGILSREFDRMLEKLVQSRAEVVKAARAAGMSEIATGVLHNVGNVLNSVNVSATLMAEQTKKSGAGDLKRVVDTIRESAGNLAGFVERDPRGKHLDPLLTQIAEQLIRENQELARELHSLTTGIDHIKELIHSQQGIAGRAGVLEEISVADLIESALSITLPASKGSPLEIVREFAPLGPCPLDRHRLMEILVNLLQNARQSLAEAELPERRLVLRLVAEGEDGLCIEVEDSGVGIAAENLSRVFTHGFTTKKEGHGFGLHASANAATEMGGKLSAHSDGLGRGAKFALALPIRRARAAAIGGGKA